MKFFNKIKNNISPQNSLFILSNKYFSRDITNQKLKKKFYKKSEIATINIDNYNNFLAINNLNHPEEENNKEIVNNFFNNLDAENLQKNLYNIKTKNLGENYQKNFEKFNIFFNASFFHKEYYAVLLDGKKCKSMHLDEIKIPSKKLAVALAYEWQSQLDLINFYKMHLVIYFIKLIN